MSNPTNSIALVTENTGEQKGNSPCTEYMDAYLNSKKEKMWTDATTLIVAATIGVSILSASLQ